MEQTIQTRFQEERFFAKTASEMVGMYAANNVYRKWFEDYLDEDSHEIIQVERHELLFTRGTLFNEMNTDSVEFYIQTGELDGIEVTNQKRLASSFFHSGLTPYKVRVSILGKKYLFIVQALSLQMAQDIVEDYVELNYDNSFIIVSASEASFGRILNEAKWKLIQKDETEDETVDLELEKMEDPEGIQSEGLGLFGSDEKDLELELTGEDADEPADDEESEDKTKWKPCYYEICIRTEVETFGINSVTGERFSKGVTSDISSFLVQAKNADEAKEMALEDCRLNRKENSEILGAVTLSASMVSCEKVIEREFTDLYIENYSTKSA